jgi:hypothetical protein
MFHCTNTRTLGLSAPLPVLNPAGTIHRAHWRPEHRATGRFAQGMIMGFAHHRSAGSPDHSTAGWSDQSGSTGWLDRWLEGNNRFNTHHRDTATQRKFGIVDFGFRMGKFGPHFGGSKRFASQIRGAKFAIFLGGSVALWGVLS